MAVSTALVPVLEECPVCNDSYYIASLGPCDHRICYKCSVRLRMVCDIKECPQCRKIHDQVIITRFTGTFISLVRSIGFQKRDFLYTENELLRDVEDLLINKCMYCPAGLAFGSFEDLRKHCNKEHGLMFCDFCYDNLKLFPSERKAYTRQQLVEHRRKGDKDDKSYKGHPACQFCNNQRFFDSDALYRHMKSDHFSCHFCESSNTFYCDYFDLRLHFASKHYLCEEGNCKEQRFTNAFGNELDLKHHRAAFHSNLMSKEELRENAKLDVAVFSRLNLSPTTARRQSGAAANEAGRRAGERGERVSKYEKRLREIQKEREARFSDTEGEVQTRNPRPAQLVPAEFPALGAASSANSGSASKLNEPESSAAERIALSTRSYNVGKVSSASEDFPALPSKPVRGPKGNTAWANSKTSSAPAPRKKNTSNKQRVASSVHSTPVLASEPSQRNSNQSNTTESRVSSSTSSNGRSHPKNKMPSKSQSEADFPPLSNYSKAAESTPGDVEGRCNAKINKSPQPIVSKAGSNKKRSKQEVLKTNNAMTDFPALPSSTKVPSVEEEESRYHAEVSGKNVSPPVTHVKHVSSRNRTPNKQKPVAVEDDFPALTSSVKVPNIEEEESRYYAKVSGNMVEPAVSKPAPPPGFSNLKPAKKVEEKPNIKSSMDFPDLPTPTHRLVVSTSASRRKGPPPGFGAPVKPVESSVQPTKPSVPSFPYWRPFDYDKRNSVLQNAITRNLNAKQLEQFRASSKRFREGNSTAFDFLSICAELFARKQLGFIISELLVLLPDIEKQSSLFEALTADSLLSTVVPHLVSQCRICGQIVTSRDAAVHRTESHDSSSALSADGLPMGDDDGRQKIDLSNYLLSSTS